MAGETQAQLRVGSTPSAKGNPLALLAMRMLTVYDDETHNMED